MAEGTQAPTLDVFILTFNAAKHGINVPVYANHLYHAFGQNATSLPELVVFCIQEMAPLAEAFIGSYMLSPYFQNFESAVNLAAAKYVAEEERQRRPKDRPYTLMRTRNVGMTGIMLFARDPAAVHNIQAAEVGFGAGDMANKGAVGLRLLYTKEDAGGDMRETELTFVGTHLSAMEWNLEKRNKNWESIVSGLVFQDPRELTNGTSPHIQGNGEEAQALLEQDSTEKALHNISIYKPGTNLFVAGDLNYRISKTSPDSDSVFPDHDPESPNHYRHFLQRDQLTAEKAAGRTLHGLSEAEVKFAPTYKLVVSPKDQPETELGRIAEEVEEEVDTVSHTFATHRWPGWCDRVLYLDIPWWTQSPAGERNRMRVTAYDSTPAVRTSDHKAVFLRIDVPVLEPSKLAPGDSASEAELDSNGGVDVDPRVKLPYPIDLASWGHRAQVKRWESVIGWSMLVSQSKQGIAVLVTVFLVGIGTWWHRAQ
ncbi:Uu.00g112590.m01.CDS01 [Anthostomella pinea]|uniref:Uu.00g112590.m01.CDS01 n=1 Tax=Anthostomella pinea TaxID=933095 RepID=A0AAI8VG95_9PEZI|nr:Uu.00g112590.m01.CDS01 [Anthostomella pinea]